MWHLGRAQAHAALKCQDNWGSLLCVFTPPTLEVTHTHTFCAGICVHAQRSVRDALTKAVQSTVDVVRFFTVPSLKSGARGTWEGAQVRV